MKLEPINDQLVVRLTSLGDHLTNAGIVLPSDVGAAPYMGEVVAAGPGRIEHSYQGPGRIPMQVQAGDAVLFSRRSGYTVRVGADEFIVMREHEVFAILREE